MEKNLATLSPVEIDTSLAALYYESQTLGMALNRAADRLHYAVGDKKWYPHGRGQSQWKLTTREAYDKAGAIAAGDGTGYQVTQAKDAIAAYRAAQAGIEANIEAQRGYGKEFRRRGGWTRAYLVNNGDGHVHSSMNCSTCNRGQYATSFQWMVEYSDHPEAEIVAAAGWRACTICYPSAPVGNPKSLPTKMFSKEDISKAEAKKEREAAKAARDAAKIAKAPTKSGEPLKVHIETYTPSSGRNAGIPTERFETFATERSAMIWAVDQATNHLTGYYRIPHLVLKGDLASAAIEVIAQAVADKRGVEVETVRAEIDKKAKAKARKSGSW